MATKTEVVKAFLAHFTHPDLAESYNHDMECQVNVAQDGGERIDGEYKGHRWNGWTDDVSVWKAFRIPWKAATDPTYTDSDMKFDFQNHVEAIGMTGWDWKAKVSKWVAFDFDSIIGHKTGLTPAEMHEVEKNASDVDWVTVRKSTSGKGIHLYVHLDPPVPTQNHTEHAALARAILGLLSALTAFDFQSRIDCCGGNMWVWHRKMKGTDGLSIIKQGIPLAAPPVNWQDHVAVTSNKARRNLPQFIENTPTTSDGFDELCGQQAQVPLDEEHKKLVDYLNEINALWWWDQDRHMMVCHTYDLKRAFNALSMRGIFDTIATGKEAGGDQNCFAFPQRKGAWSVRRHSRGVQEHSSWEQDGQGWTRTYLNKDPDLRMACRAYGGVEDPNGGFIFREAETAQRAAALLGAHVEYPPRLNGRECKLIEHKRDGRLIVEIKHETSDPTTGMEHWLPKKDKWARIYNVSTYTPAESAVGSFDDLVRHIVTVSGDDCGWLIYGEEVWRNEPLTHIRLALEASGHAPRDVKSITGSSILKCWTLVNRPFQPEYPGNRTWNRNAAQLRFVPTADTDSLQYPTWKKLLSHCGQGLNEAIEENGWCKANGIVNGFDYLKCWLASLFQQPLEPLPYLFLYGPQNSGKSSLHEAIDLLVTTGCVRADHAIENQSGFNGELENAVVCVIEETNIAKNKQAYNRIKDWVTSKQLSIRKLYHTPYHVPNATHWIQCANDHTACPIFPGDTRITMCYVPSLDPTDLIPKKILLPHLEKEAPDFLAELLNLELPRSDDRLNVPIIATSDKEAAAGNNQTDVERFISEQCYLVDGESIKFADFYNKFINWLDPNAVSDYSKIRVGRELPPQTPRGRASWDTGQFHIANLSFVDMKPVQSRLILRDGSLRHIE